MTGWPQYVALLPFAIVAAGTDASRGKIYNWTTYPAMLVGLIVNIGLGGIEFGVAEPFRTGGGWSWSGAGSGAGHAALGWLVCGFVMLFCFVLFAIGGGDVKLMAMIGAFLGIDHGIEVLLWTFVVGAVISIAMLIWQVGLIELLGLAFGQLWWTLRTGGKVPMTEEERAPLKRVLYLAAASLPAVVLVMLRRDVW